MRLLPDRKVIDKRSVVCSAEDILFVFEEDAGTFVNQEADDTGT